MGRLPRPAQVAFAEIVVRIKGRAVPDEFYRDKALISKWIDGNKRAPSIRLNVSGR